MENNMRLIDANALREHIMSFAGMFSDETGFVISMDAVLAAIEYAHTVDAAEVVHSRWINEVAGYKNCLECGSEHPTIDRLGYNVADDFCPSCGAKMDLKEEDNAE